jgi:hypothetical protein
MAYSSVIFNEGEPLDPTKLNQLQLNLSDVYKTSLSNATLNDQGAPTLPVVYSGQRTWKTTLNAGTRYQSSGVTLPQSFDFNEPIYTTASVAQQLPASTQISVSCYISSNTLLVDVISNKDLPGLIVHFIATQQKSV